MALRGVEIGALSRGMVLASPGAARPGEWLDARLAVLASAPAPVPDGATLRLLTGTMEVAARLRLPAGGALAPGDVALVQLRCDPPVAAMAGDGFVLRLASPSRSIGGGVILDPGAVRRRRADLAARPRLEAAAAADWAAATLGLLRECGGAGARPQALVPRLGQAAARLRGWALAGGAREVADGTLLHPAAWDGMLAGLRATLGAFHAAQPMAAGMRPEALRATLPAGVPEAVAAALLADAGFDREHGLLRLPGFDPVRAMAAEGAT